MLLPLWLPHLMSPVFISSHRPLKSIFLPQLFISCLPQHSVIAQNVGGIWLCTAIIVACFLGNMGLYIAKMFENSWQMQGMAAAGVIPSVFKQIHPRFRSPWNATILSFFIIAILVSFDFNFIVTIDTTFNCAAALLEMFAFFSLRMNRPNLKRPFKIPVHSRLGLCLFLTPPVIIGSFVLFNGFFESLYTAAVNVAATLLGFALFFIMKKMGLVNYTYKTRKESGVDSGSEESVDESIPLIHSSSDEERKSTKVVRRASSFRQVISIIHYIVYIHILSAGFVLVLLIENSQ